MLVLSVFLAFLVALKFCVWFHLDAFFWLMSVIFYAQLLVSIVLVLRWFDQLRTFNYFLESVLMMWIVLTSMLVIRSALMSSKAYLILLFFSFLIMLWTWVMILFLPFFRNLLFCLSLMDFNLMFMFFWIDERYRSFQVSTVFLFIVKTYIFLYWCI